MIARPHGADVMTADFIVVGAGPAGATAARELAREGFRVLMLAPAARRPVPLGETLPPDARHLLRAAGIECEFLAQGHAPRHGLRSAWGDEELVEENFIFHPDGAGWQLDRPTFDSLLIAAAEAAGAVILRECRVRAFGFEAGRARVLAEQEGRAIELRAAAAVEGSGRACVVARMAGAARRSLDRLTGVACVMRDADREGEALGLVEAVAEGWWYSTPVPEGRLAIFFSDADLPALRAARTREGWLEALRRTRHLRALVAARGCRLAASPCVIAAGSACLAPVCGAGWLAVGDAALSHDPLSGRGIAAALSGGRSGARAFAAFARGDMRAVEAYSVEAGHALARYREALRTHYGAERRWPSEPFWQRRSQLHRGVQPPSSERRHTPIPAGSA
jgi:flavin-dependent dehydrogenase